MEFPTVIIDGTGRLWRHVGFPDPLPDQLYLTDDESCIYHRSFITAAVIADAFGEPLLTSSYPLTSQHVTRGDENLYVRFPLPHGLQPAVVNTAWSDSFLTEPPW